MRSWKEALVGSWEALLGSWEALLGLSWAVVRTADRVRRAR